MYNYGNYVSSMFNSEEYDQRNLQRSAESVLEALCQDHLKCAQEHSTACLEWQKSGKHGEMPARRVSNLLTFSELFSQIFPDIALHFNEHEVSVQCEQKGNRYEPNQLSTGEKQVFLLLGRFIDRSQPEVFLIDEPDRNLNPKLAEVFWTTLENWHHEQSAFVYATHLPSFALRTNVDRVFLLDGEQALAVDGAAGFLRLPADQRSEFLGTIPSIVIRDKVLVVEGEDGGIDDQFYTHLLNDKRIEIVPVRDCHRVRSAVSGTEPWDRVTSGVRMVGLIDSDFRSADQIGRLIGGVNERIIALPVHEVENLLCQPSILDELFKKKYSDSNRPPLDKLLGHVLELAREQAIGVAIRRTKEVLASQLSVSSLSGEEMRAIGDPGAAHVKLAEKQRALKLYVDAMQPEAIFDAELARVTNAIERHDWNAINLYFEGKQLLRPICGFIGVADASHLLNEVIHHCPAFAESGVLKNLRDSIGAKFQ